MSLIETIGAVGTQLNELTRSNPFYAVLLGGSGAALIFSTLRRLPLMIWGAFYSQVTTKVNISNNGESWYNEVRYFNFLFWFQNSRWVKLSRSVSLDSGQSWGPNDTNNRVIAGYGRHVFIYKRHLFIFVREMIESQGTLKQRENITLTMFGRNKEIISDLLDDFTPKVNKNTISVFSNNQNDTYLISSAVPRRSLESVIVAGETLQDIVGHIDKFMASEDWYKHRGIPWKLILLFVGPPGTGKTSIIRALASHYKRDIFDLNLNTASQSSLRNLILEGSGDSFIAIEDVDGFQAVKTRVTETSSVRDLHTGRVQTMTPAPTSSGNKADPVTLNGLLNAFDGLATLDGKIIFMTTNHLEHIDPAIIRPGRVDQIIPIGVLTNVEVHKYFKFFYDGYEIPENIVFEDVAASTIQRAMIAHRGAPDKAWETLDYTRVSEVTDIKEYRS